MIIRVKGRSVHVPSLEVGGRTIYTTGRLPRMAQVHDEDFIDGVHIQDPTPVLEAIKHVRFPADILTFSQPLTAPQPRHDFLVEWDNAAVIPVQSYDDWWHNRVSQGLRKDVKRAHNRGVVVKVVEFTDDFVRGIMGIYNETPVRQGRKFWHYGKPFDAVKLESATYLDQSIFLGAYVGDELIGFLKIVRVGTIGRLMFILSKVAHQDKRPTNALIAKAVEVCEKEHLAFLTYGNYTYEDGAANSLTAFKQRNGFEPLNFARYLVPLNARGRLCLRLKLHKGFKAMLPVSLVNRARQARSRLYGLVSRTKPAPDQSATA